MSRALSLSHPYAGERGHRSGAQGPCPKESWLRCQGRLLVGGEPSPDNDAQSFFFTCPPLPYPFWPCSRGDPQKNVLNSPLPLCSWSSYIHSPPAASSNEPVMPLRRTEGFTAVGEECPTAASDPHTEGAQGKKCGAAVALGQKEGSFHPDRRDPISKRTARMSPVQELFHEAAQQGALAQRQPWWKSQLFLREPVLFGTWDGVFTSCMINIFGVVLFLRTGWLVGNTGVLMGMFLVSFVVLVALITVLSGIGVGDHCGVGSGGVYSMISSVLGGQTGGTIGLLYVFGQCVAGAMYITGFAESVSDLLSFRSIWAVRGMSVVVLLALLGINLAGVKWIIRLQLLLLFLLAVSTLDFVVGSFTHLDPEHGFVGYSPELLWNNTLPDYSPGESFFTVFGVFFPAATGVMAGFNMGGDLREPAASIPLGSLAAVGISWFLYLVFVFLLGAACTREALRYDFLIAEKVSLVGFLFLLGLYISSLASCMGGLYGAPRILQCIAQEKVIPALACLGQGKGPNKTPVAAIFLTSLVTMAFVLVGQVNVLAPIVTINFMLTYIAVDYSYFSLSMVPCSLPQVPESVHREGTGPLHCSEHLLLEKAPSYGSEDTARSLPEGTLLEFTKDMDQLLQLTRKLENSQPRQGDSDGLPESKKGKRKKATKQTLQDSFLLDLKSPASFAAEGSDRLPTASWEGQEAYWSKQSTRSEGVLPGGTCAEQRVPEPSKQPVPTGEDFFLKSTLQEQDIQRPTSFYTHMCNPWVSLLGAFGSLLIMFVIQWVYTLINMGVAAIVYFYIGRASPGLHLGSASSFSFLRWMKSLLIPSCRSLRSPRERIILAPSLARVDMEMTQLTQENADFAARDRYHHSSPVSREQLMAQY